MARLVPLVTAAVAVVLQITVAPLLSFSSVVPNFLVALSIVLSVVRSSDSSYGYAFVLGLIADLLAQTPLGLTSALLLIGSFFLSRIFEVMDRSTIAMPLVACVVSVVMVSLITSITLLILGYEGSFLDLIVYRVFPEAFVNSLLCALFFFISRKFAMDNSAGDVWKISRSDRFR